MLEIPLDVQCVIGDYLENTDYAAMRLVWRDLRWTTHRLYLHGHSRAAPPTMLRRCLRCRARTLTYLMWRDGFACGAIPWCELHAPIETMANIDLFCVGGLDRQI